MLGLEWVAFDAFAAAVARLAGVTYESAHIIVAVAIFLMGAFAARKLHSWKAMIRYR